MKQIESNQKMIGHRVVLGKLQNYAKAGYAIKRTGTETMGKKPTNSPPLTKLDYDVTYRQPPITLSIRLLNMKKLFCLLFTAVCLIASQNVKAQVIWTPVAENNVFIVGMDYDSLKRQGNITSVRVREFDKAESSTMYEDLEFDCKNSKFRSVWGKLYNRRNKVRYNESTPNAPWDMVEPKTLMSVIMMKACK